MVKRFSVRALGGLQKEALDSPPWFDQEILGLIGMFSLVRTPLDAYPLIDTIWQIPAVRSSVPPGPCKKGDHQRNEVIIHYFRLRARIHVCLWNGESRP
jgi:hypothetical protein